MLRGRYLYLLLVVGLAIWGEAFSLGQSSAVTRRSGRAITRSESSQPSREMRRFVSESSGDEYSLKSKSLAEDSEALDENISAEDVADTLLVGDDESEIAVGSSEVVGPFNKADSTEEEVIDSQESELAESFYEVMDDRVHGHRETQEPEDESEESKEEEEPAETFLDWVPHSAGGLVGESIYTGEVFTNTRGGINTNKATRYRGNLDVIINGDMEELFGLTGTSFFIYGGQIHGKSLTYNDVGDWQVISSIDPYPYVDVTQMQEYWVKQEFLDGDLAFKFGYQDANADFGFSDLAGDFINNSFVTIPTIPMPIWPAQSQGISGFAKVNESINLGLGIYQSNKLGYLWGNSRSGQDGFVTVGHVEFKTQVGTQSELPGTFRFGGWFDSGRWGQITSAPVAAVYGHNYGFFSSGDQLLFKEDYSTEDEQGLGVFYEMGWAPKDRNYIESYFGTGVVYRGLIPGRDLDITGLGVADIRFGGPTMQRDSLSHETVTETFYKARINDYLMIQPDIQFVANPGGNGRDALAVGIRFELVL